MKVSSANYQKQAHFKGTVQISISGEYKVKDTVRAAGRILNEHTPTAITNFVVDLDTGVHSIKASYQKGDKILAALSDLIERFTSCKIDVHYSTRYHSLSLNELEKIDLTQQ